MSQSLELASRKYITVSQSLEIASVEILMCDTVKKMALGEI